MKTKRFTLPVAFKGTYLDVDCDVSCADDRLIVRVVEYLPGEGEDPLEDTLGRGSSNEVFEVTAALLQQHEDDLVEYFKAKVLT